LRFGEVIIAVATLTVVYVLLYSVLLVAFIPTVGTFWAMDAAAIVSLLIASLIVGVVFAGQIREARMSSIGRIAVLFAIVIMSASMAMGSNPYMGDSLKEGLESMYSTSGWTTTDWFTYSQMVLVLIVAVNIVLALVLGFVGLYAGSMLRRGGTS